MKLIFEEGASGRGSQIFPSIEEDCGLPQEMLRSRTPRFPDVSETELSRHYTALAKNTYGVNNGIYPLGSCTMKYNPKVNETLAALPGFTDVHPLADDEDVQGCLEILKETEKYLCTITGMDACTFQPAAGAHGEFTGLLIIKAWHESRGDVKRKKIFIPDSAHGTNPASATMAGFEVVNIASDENGRMDLDELKHQVGEDTAGLMLTAPNTLGLFNPNIDEITNIIHKAGGLCYYDGANLNAIMGVIRPADLGFDVMHINLHKTFSTPHGGGGPGSGPVACKSFLVQFLPGRHCELSEEGYIRERKENSVGDIRSFDGNFLVILRAFCYISSLGKEGILEAAQMAVLNANYLMSKLKDEYKMACSGKCMHEFVITVEDEKKKDGITALDIAKALIDEGIHPPTMYFPLIVHEALMIEPTETESRQTLDETAKLFFKVIRSLRENPEEVHKYPQKTIIGRPDEVKAARNPVLGYYG